ncbi:hypothetical protein R9C00_03755 [Flammeovirgaceae bacterium SG7u.111]|nr:hypothetical protein [Flammeovirgaceae bacterium SG7u.132]WPO36560.1 hypothetical protein R9C00_03755 [Flammeovirgaceae bacterium SG7u.111]
MALKTSVKVSKVGNLHDARYCAGMGVDMIGIPVSEGMEGYIPSENFTEIVGWLAGVKYVGEITSVDVEKLGEYKLDYIEATTSAEVEQLKALGTPIILKLEEVLERPAEVEELLAKYESEVAFFILELKEIPSGAEEGWLAGLSEKYSVWLKGAINVENVHEVLDTFSPKGLVLTGSEEIKTGVNDFDALADVLEALDTDEYA